MKRYFYKILDKYDNPELKSLISTNIVITIVMAFNMIGMAFLWGHLGNPLAFKTTMIAGSLMLINVIQFFIFKNWFSFRITLIFIMLTTAFVSHAVMGGFLQSGGIIIWGIMVVCWGAVIEKTKLKYFWLGSYIGGVIILSFFDQQFSSAVEPFGEQVVLFTIVNMIVSISATLFILFNLYIQRLDQEKKHAEKLLLNILPDKTAKELIENGAAIPRLYKAVSVLFTDFKNFTNIAERLTPEELVEELHYCFKHFDRISKVHGLEKIKTIGDSYLCVSGLPNENENHASNIVAAAKEFIQFVDQWNENKKKNNQDLWEVRIGINSGPVVAGVVGESKFAYDIWGDTVNLASRMESSGELGKINISEHTYDIIKDEIDCVGRGALEVKNKGHVNMYFIR